MLTPKAFDAGMAAFLADAAADPVALATSSLKSYMDPGASDAEILAALSNQTLPAVNNRHSASCATCHLGEAVVGVVVSGRKRAAGIDPLSDAGLEEFESHLARLPIARGGLGAGVKFDRQVSQIWGAGVIAGLPEWGFRTTRAFGYFNETPHCSLRAFAEISAQTDAFARLSL